MDRWEEIKGDLPIDTPIQVNYGKNGAVGEFVRKGFKWHFLSVGNRHIIFLPRDSWMRSGITHYKRITMRDFPQE